MIWSGLRPSGCVVASVVKSGADEPDMMSFAPMGTPRSAEHVHALPGHGRGCVRGEKKRDPGNLG